MNQKRGWGRNEEASLAQRLRKEYRIALMELGRSPDTHLADIINEKQHYFVFGREKEKNYLARLVSFYRRLPDCESRLLFHDIFYQTRHYCFWYVASMSEREHRKRYKNLALFLEGYLHAA